MSQTQQYKKVKLYRNLKVVFYLLGLPLFLLAVFFSAVRFLGHDPFMGTTELTTELGFFKQIESYITAPALYGVWIGFGVWAFITIVHIILSKTVKNDRARMLAVIATCMVVMLGTGFILDIVYEAKVADLQEQYAGTGVTIDDYKTQLSYYRTVSSNAASKSYTTKLIDQVHLLEDVYNVEMEGANKSGTAGNISNKPVTYYNVIDDNGNQGVDICYEENETTGLYELAFEDKANNILKGDGDLESIKDHSYRVNPSSVYASESSYYDYKKSPEYQTIITLAPNANGKLEINGTVYSHYWCKERSTTTQGTIYVWYCTDLMPIDANGNHSETVEITDGIWGKGVYNSNGLFGDGWVYSLDNVIEILADYYEYQALVENIDQETLNYIYGQAARARDNYYNGTITDPDGNYASAFEQALYKNENDFAERFSLTDTGLDYLVAKLGAMLGNNKLFDLLLRGSGLDDVVDDAGFGGIIGMTFEPIFDSLAQGVSFKDPEGLFKMTDESFNTALTWIGLLSGCDSAQLSSVKDIYLIVSYNNPNFPLNLTPDDETKGLYVGLVADVGSGLEEDAVGHLSDGEGNVLVDLWLDDQLVDEDGNGELDWAMDLDHLNAFLNAALNGLMEKFDVSIEELCKGEISSLLGLITGSELGTMEIVGSLVGPNGLLKLITTMYVEDETSHEMMTYYGLEISGISIPLIKGTTYEFDINIKTVLLNLLASMYNYQSPCIKPVWEFYTWDPGDHAEEAEIYKNFQKAEYQAVTWGSTIGSTLVGDTLGAGSYPSSLGLTDLTSVLQLKADLSYKPSFYPVYAVRDMLFFFTGVVVLFYYLSFVCAQKEEEYATGNLVAKNKKKSKKSNKTDKDAKNSDVATLDIQAGDNGNPPVGKEGEKTPDDQNNKGGAVK